MPFKPLRGLFSLAYVLTFILGGAVPLTAEAEEIDVTSRIEAVTIFPTGAEIMRSFTVDLTAGDHQVRLLLPNDIQKNSVQIEATTATDLSIKSLELRPEPVNAEARKARDDALRAEIAAIEAGISRDTKVIENALLARDLIETLARRRMQPDGPETTPPVPEPDDLTALLDLVDNRLSRISETILDAQAKIEASHQRIASLEMELAEPSEPTTRNMLASIHLTARDPGETTFELRYRLGSAAWQPVYEARLSTGEGGQAAQMELVRNASVAQETDEEWRNVRLIISSAQRTSQITSPTLSPLSVARFIRDAENAQEGRAVGSPFATAAGLQSDSVAAETVERMQAAAIETGFNTLFDIPGQVSIDNSGTARSLRIGAMVSAAELSLAASPKIDLTAYLIARFTVVGEAPLLPGRVMLFRDDVFVGEAFLPLATPGEMLELGFGADDLVRIERREVARKSGETGLVATAYIEERSYLTRITSGHSFNIPITIEDQTPVTDDERVRVEFLPGTTRPDDADVDGRSGVYSWTRMLKPGLTEEIGFGFRITRPKGSTR